MSGRGFTLVELLVSIAILAVLTGLVLGGVQAVRSRSERLRCGEKLRQVGLAAQNYHAIHGHFPIGLTSDTAKHPRMSWLVQLLPHLERGAEWQESLDAYARNVDPFYDPPHKLFQTPMPPYVCPSDPRGLTRQPSHGRWVALTSYVGNFGIDVDHPNGMLVSSTAIRGETVSDGLSNTLFAGERPASTDMWYGWWYTSYGQRGTGNADMLLGVREINTFTPFARDCPAGPYDYQPGRFDQQCDLFHFWSPHAGGANFIFGDGSARFVKYSASDILPALATRSGGESAEVP